MRTVPVHAIVLVAAMATASVASAQATVNGGASTKSEENIRVYTPSSARPAEQGQKRGAQGAAVKPASKAAATDKNGNVR